MKKLIILMLALFALSMAGLLITGCNSDVSPAEEVYQEEASR